MWSNERKSAIKGFEFYVRCRTTEIMLGTVPGDPNIHRNYIIAKRPLDDHSELIAEEEAAAQELAMSNRQLSDVEQDMNITIFPQARFIKISDSVYLDPQYDVIPEGQYEEVILPFLYDYQWRGSFKESISMLTKASGGKKNASEDTYKYACAGITNYKKVVDGSWFVPQHKIPLHYPKTYRDMNNEEQSTLDANGNFRLFTRTMRVDTMQGPRVAMATSEWLPAGTEFWFPIRLLNIQDLKPLLETLDYKAFVGMLQWRGGGHGTLIWTLCDKYGVPYDEQHVNTLSKEDLHIISTINALYDEPICTPIGYTTEYKKPSKKTEKIEPAAVVVVQSGPITEDTPAPAPKKRGRKPKVKVEE